MKLRLSNHQAPGDILMLTALVRELKEQHPHFEIYVDSSTPAFWENNPHIENDNRKPIVFDTLSDVKESALANMNRIQVKYCDDDGKVDNPWSLHKLHEHKKHFIWGMIGFLSAKMHLPLTVKTHHADLYLTDEEKKPFDDLPAKYWVVNCGSKPDCPAKQWNIDNWRKVFDSLPNITFIQMGGKEKDHIHPDFSKCKNVINLTGQTTLRKSLTLLYNAQGLMSGVTFAMHAWAALHHNDNKPMITIAGGREHWWWEAYPSDLGYKHHYLHTMGALNCCTELAACWKSDCTNKAENGFPKCLEMITPESVAAIVGSYEY